MPGRMRTMTFSCLADARSTAVAIANFCLVPVVSGDEALTELMREELARYLLHLDTVAVPIPLSKAK